VTIIIYEPCYLKNIQNSLERHLKNRQYSVSLTNGREFHKSRQLLKAKQIELKKQGNGNHPNAATAITEDEIDRLWGSGQLGGGNPGTFLHTLWWQNTTQFGMRAGYKEHTAMCWGDVALKVTPDGREYLERTVERQTKTRHGDDPENVRDIKPRAYATCDERCPVAAYKQHRDNRPTDLCNPNGAFYLGTIHNPRVGQKLFRRQRLGPGKLQKFMGIMTKLAGIVSDGKISNTSARKYQVQTLSDHSVHPTHIQQLTGHRSIQSVNRYCKLNPAQREQYSHTLSHPNASATAVMPAKRPASAPMSPGGGSVAKFSKTTVSSTHVSAPPQPSLPFSLFAGATITGGTINVTLQIPSPTKVIQSAVVESELTLSGQ
jgi:hypothetical protein